MKVAVSKCLLGENCRYDGTNKLSAYIQDLYNYFDVVGFCPEGEAFGTPRDTISLRLVDGSIDVINNNTKNSVKKTLQEYNNKTIKNLINNNILAIISKSKSPSCGVSDTKIYTNNFEYIYVDGLLIQNIKDSIKNIIIINENDFANEFCRYNFFVDTKALYDLSVTNLSAISDLVSFHTRYKFCLLSRGRINYTKLGNIVANHEKYSFALQCDMYKQLFVETIQIKADIKNFYNSLLHMVGFMKNNLSNQEKSILHQNLQNFFESGANVFAIADEIKCYAKKYNITYIGQQLILL